jgi:hypothetical protein
MYLDGDISIKHWRTTAPTTWAEGSYGWIGIDILGTNVGLYAPQDECQAHFACTSGTNLLCPRILFTRRMSYPLRASYRKSNKLKVGVS